MSKSYTELTEEIVRLGGCDLQRDDPRVVLAHGGFMAGKIRVAVTLVKNDHQRLTPMRARRLLNRIKDKLQGPLQCTLQGDGDMNYTLFVEDRV
jgi:hypothetical protein